MRASRCLVLRSPCGRCGLSTPRTNQNGLIAEALPARVMRDEAKVRAAAAFIAVVVGAARCAGIAGRQAGLIRLAGQRETGQRHSHQTEAEPFEGLPPRNGLGHHFGQLIEFLVHNFFLLIRS